MENATEVRYGGVVVGRSPQIRDQSEDGAFVVFSEPLPVGSAIALKIDDKERHARVTEVVESADTAAAGMRVRFGAAAEKNAPAPAPVRPARAAQPAAAAPVPAAAPVVAEPPPVRAPEPPAPVVVAAAAPEPVVVAAAAPAAAAREADQASAPVPVAVPAGGEAGSQGVHPATDSHAHHHDGEGGRRRRRRK